MPLRNSTAGRGSCCWSRFTRGTFTAHTAPGPSLVTRLRRISRDAPSLPEEVRPLSHVAMPATFESLGLPRPLLTVLAARMPRKTLLLALMEEASIAAVELLSPRDSVGVIAFDGEGGEYRFTLE